MLDIHFSTFAIQGYENVTFDNLLEIPPNAEEPQEKYYENKLVLNILWRQFNLGIFQRGNLWGNLSALYLRGKGDWSFH